MVEDFLRNLECFIRVPAEVHLHLFYFILAKRGAVGLFLILKIGASVGDVRTQLQGYVDNDRITSYGGASPFCFPVVSFLDGYTYVKTRACVTYLPADLNQDCYVDTLDFAIMAAHWLDCTEPTDSNCVQ